MLRLFKRIRWESMNREKIRKYLLYTLGEVFLVVVGILIALGVNNRNENHKDRTFELKMLSEVSNALEADRLHYIQMSDKMKGLRESAHFFVDYLAEEKTMHDSLFNKFFALNSGISIQTNKGPYSAIKAVGLDKISHDSLRNQLIRFYDFTYPRFIESLEHYDRNSVRDIERIIGFLEDPYIFQRDGQNLLAQDFNPDILYDPQFHRVLRSIFFRTNSLIRIIGDFMPVMEEMIIDVENEITMK